MRTDAHLHRILQRFGLKGQPLERVGPVMKIQADDRLYALKEFETADAIAFQVAIARYLKQNGYPNGQRFYPAADGRYIVQEGDRFYLLARWFSGTHPKVTEWPQLKALVQELAHFHLAATGLTDPQGAPLTSGRLQYDTFPSVLEERHRDLVNWSNHYQHPTLTKAIRLAEQSLAAFDASVFAQLADSERQQHAFVHGDYNYPNVILMQQPPADTPRIRLIDLDNASYNVRLTDLIHVIQRNWGKDPSHAKRMIRAYHRIRPLSEHEFALLTSAVSFPAQFWRVLHIARYKKRQIKPEHLLAWSRLYLAEHAAARVRDIRLQTEE